MLDCLLCFIQVVLPEVVSPRFLMYGLTHLYIFYAIPAWVLVLLHLSWFFIGALVGDDMLGFFSGLFCYIVALCSINSVMLLFRELMSSR